MAEWKSKQQVVSTRWQVAQGKIPGISIDIYICISEDRQWWDGVSALPANSPFTLPGRLRGMSPLYEKHPSDYWDEARQYIIKELLPTLESEIAEKYNDLDRFTDLEI